MLRKQVASGAANLCVPKLNKQPSNLNSIKSFGNKKKQLLSAKSLSSNET